MEAVAAFSLACNVIQVVDVSWKAYEIYKQIREHGTTVRIEELRYTTQQLTECVNSLRNSVMCAPNQFGPIGSGVELTDLSTKCIATAEDLETQLRKLDISSSSSRISAVIKTGKAKWKSDRIEEVKRKLDEYVSVLDSKILVHLSQVIGSLAEQQTEILSQLSQSELRIYDKLAAGNTSVSDLIRATDKDLKAHTTQEHTLTRLHINTKLGNFADAQQLQAGFEKFLETLHFPEINQRQGNIEDAHRKTFEWIFDKSADTTRPWDSFLEWTEDDNPVYWILGKAGSGKSTLMNFLVQDTRTKAALEHPLADTPALFITFFFWEAGVELQKNQVGLLRSLIWQILTSMDSPTSIQIWSDVIRKGIPSMPTVWTQKQLQSILRTLVHAIRNRVCLFLDGLDEFQGIEDQVDAITDILQTFQDRQNVKICLSSRWSTSLDSLYPSCPKLQLQDLTRTDIRLYVEDKLGQNLRTWHHQLLVASQPYEMSQLIDDIVNKAEGVFLWVRLTTESLLRGMRKDDDFQTLRDRVEQMPEGIFNLYEHMWKRMATDYPLYAKDAAVYLQLVKQFYSMSLVGITIACDEKLQEEYLGASATWDLECFGKDLNLARLKRRLMARCAGFLEVRESGILHPSDSWTCVLRGGKLAQYPETMNRLDEIRQSHRRTEVSFLHRTALEYLRTESGKKLLQAQPLSERELHLRRHQSRLVLLVLCSKEVSPFAISTSLEYMHSKEIRKSLSEEDLVAMFLHLEAVCDKLISLGICSEIWMRSKWPLVANMGKVDFAKAFLATCPAAYIERKLRLSGLMHNVEYLTDLLRSCLAWHDDYNARHHRSMCEKIHLLLKLGADPNQKLLASSTNDKPGRDFTIWAYVVAGSGYGPEAIAWPPQNRIAEAFLQVGADPGVRIRVILTPEKRDSNPEIQWLSVDELETCDNPFMLWQVSPRIMSKFLFHRVEEDLLSNMKGVCERKCPVVFVPPNAWCTVATERVVDGLGFDRRWTSDACHFDSVRLSQSIDKLKDFLEKTRDQQKFFDNGVYALRAAGYSDEEIRELPIPQTVWEDHRNGNGEIQDLDTEEFLRRM